MTTQILINGEKPEDLEARLRRKKGIDQAIKEAKPASVASAQELSQQAPTIPEPQQAPTPTIQAFPGPVVEKVSATEYVFRDVLYMRSRGVHGMLSFVLLEVPSPALCPQGGWTLQQWKDYYRVTIRNPRTQGLSPVSSEILYQVLKIASRGENSTVSEVGAACHEFLLRMRNLSNAGKILTCSTLHYRKDTLGEFVKHEEQRPCFDIPKRIPYHQLNWLGEDNSPIAKRTEYAGQQIYTSYFPKNDCEFFTRDLLELIHGIEGDSVAGFLQQVAGLDESHPTKVFGGFTKVGRMLKGERSWSYEPLFLREVRLRTLKNEERDYNPRMVNYESDHIGRIIINCTRTPEKTTGYAIGVHIPGGFP